MSTQEVLMLEAEQPIQTFPAGDGATCPICKSTDVRGTVDHITGLAEMDDDCAFIGHTDVDWDSQTTVTSVNGDPLVQCGCFHWYFAVGYTMDGEGITPIEERS